MTSRLRLALAVAMLAFGALPLMLVVLPSLRVLVSPQGAAPAVWLEGDYRGFYVAGEAATTAPATAYDRAAQLDRLEALLGPHKPLPWSYPPPTLFLVWPLGVLPGPAGRLAWNVTLLLAAAATGFVAARGRGAAAAIAFPGTAHAIAIGHPGTLGALAFAGAVSAIDRRPIVAGAALGLLAYKPQFLIGPLLLLLVLGRLRAVLACVAVGVLAALASLVAFGPETWSAFLAEATTRGRDVAGAGLPLARFVTVYGQIATVASLPRAVAVAAHVAVAAAALAAAAATWRRSDDAAIRSAALVLVALIVSPYGFEYDLVMLAAPASWLAGAVLSGRAPGWPALAGLAACLAAPVIAAMISFGTGMQPLAFVLPLALGALALLSGRARRMAGMA